MKRLFVSLLLLAACGAPPAVPVEELVRDLGPSYGKVITVRTRFKSGARCRQGEDGKWKTYCKDCQYCRGPLVADLPLAATASGAEDWPLIMGGTWEGQDIRCKGPLNQIECYPFELGKTYVVRGVLEHQRPPKLLVERFWRAD